ncbi:uncharacterized protein [Palaemon carinicauda]|uniref:uncharacterized protein isoform X3 n=1 Tax=Palaemon carinicauda TaxID=392227 RepID=UPI0035B6878D
MKEIKQGGAATLVVLLLIILSTQVMHHHRNTTKERILSRQKRLFFLTSDRRVALPSGTEFFLQFTLNLPFSKDLPVGYTENMLITVLLKAEFDKAKMTSNENPFSFWPYFRKRRDLSVEGSHAPDRPAIDFSDGDRRVLYQVLEGMLHNMGLGGSPCLQRAICEFFQEPLKYHGFFGEMLKLLFSPSNYPEADIHLKEYVEAEKTGKSTGKCDLYQRLCSRSFYTNGTSEHIAVDAKDRQKRFIYITPERRIAFPPETLFTVTFILLFPGRLLPPAHRSSLQITLPVKVKLDDVGLTTEDHPFANLDEIFRRKRRVGEEPRGINWAGGDREVMYFTIENTLESIGMNGKACLLRAICEMFQAPLDRYGILGEALEIFFSPSLSPYPEFRLGDYLEAELIGRSSGVCVDYEEDCSHSLFTDSKFESSHLMDIIDSLMSMIKLRST